MPKSKHTPTYSLPDPLEPRGLFRGAPALVILDRQLDAMLAQHRFGEAHRTADSVRSSSGTRRTSRIARSAAASGLHAAPSRPHSFAACTPVSNASRSSFLRGSGTLKITRMLYASSFCRKLFCASGVAGGRDVSMPLKPSGDNAPRCRTVGRLAARMTRNAVGAPPMRGDRTPARAPRASQAAEPAACNHIAV